MPTRRQFTGQLNDSEIGLYFYGARSYSAVLGRFISADTLVPQASDPQSWNRYSYTRNRPLNRIDPSGHKDCEDSGPCADAGGSMADDPGGGGCAADCPPIEPNGPIGDHGGPYQKVYTDENGNVVRVPFKTPLTEAQAELIDSEVSAGNGTTAETPAKGYIRAIPEDQVGTSQPFKTLKNEDGLSTFEGVSPEQVLKELPGKRIPNTTVEIPRTGLPEGTKIIPTEAEGLSQLLSDAHRILVRPDGWSIDRFAKALKILVGWGGITCHTLLFWKTLENCRITENSSVDIAATNRMFMF